MLDNFFKLPEHRTDVARKKRGRSSSSLRLHSDWSSHSWAD